MGFHNVVLPDKFLGPESVTGPGHLTFLGDEVPDSGIRDQRPSRWAQSRRKFQVSVTDMPKSDASELMAFVLARQGSAHSFLIKDPLDYTTNASDPTAAPLASDVFIGADPTGVKLYFDLFKDYGGMSGRRYLHRIIPGTVLLARNGTVLTEGTDYVVDHFLGKVLIPTPTIGSYSAGCQFYVKVRFDKQVDDMMSTVFDDWENLSADIPMVEDNTEQIVVVGTGFAGGHTGNTSRKDYDRAHIDPERTNYGGWYTDSSHKTPGTVYLSWGHSRFYDFEPSSKVVDVFLPNIVGLAGVTVATGGPHFIVSNTANFDLTAQLKEYTNAAGTTSRPILSRAKVGPRTIRELWIDDNANWRAV